MTIKPWTALVAAAGIFAAGGGAAYVWSTRHAAPPATTTPPATATTNSASPAAAVEIDGDLAARAGVETQPAATGAIDGGVRVPGTVQPNAYRQVKVMPLVAGRVTRMLVELGQPVARGAAIAEIYSPDAADARARYLTLKADTDAGEARLRRAERLAAIGSASQQELEQVRAEHVRHETEMQQAADRLRLLGIDPEVLGDPHAAGASVLVIKAPQAGVVTERPAASGSTADASTPLATISELSPVWVIADVYERDIAAVKVDTPATITSPAYPGSEWHGRVTYVSPDVRAETRTAQVRVEIANAGDRLKFGMFVTVAIAAPGTPHLVVPASAVQTIGADSVVFVPEAGSATRFRERRVVLGARDGERVAVVEGLAPGERVVTKGSFDLRAEAERQGVRPGAAVQEAAVAITDRGFEPASLTLRRGVPARITFTRRTDRTCATELAIPRYAIRRDLPLDRPVTVEFVPQDGEAVFQCGMGMLTGTLVVR